MERRRARVGNEHRNSSQRRLPAALPIHSWSFILCLCAMKNLICFRYERIINWQMFETRKRRGTKVFSGIISAWRRCVWRSLRFLWSSAGIFMFGESQRIRTEQKWMRSRRKVLQTEQLNDSWTWCRKRSKKKKEKSFSSFFRFVSFIVVSIFHFM